MKPHRFFTLVLLLFLFSVCCISPTFAASDMPRLVDDANLLSAEEKTELLNKLDEISNRQQMDIVVVTVDSLEGASAMQYADNFYDMHGYGFGTEKDGVLFLISMEERDWYITTTGYGITAFTDAGLEYLSEQFLNDLSTGAYATAFTIFAELCDDFITQARNGNPYDISFAEESFAFARNFGIAFGIAFLLSLLITESMKRKLKNVHYQAAADNYIKKGSMQMIQKSDLFLYQNVNRRKKVKNNTNVSHASGSHTSSSGRMHGGRGGKF